MDYFWLPHGGHGPNVQGLQSIFNNNLITQGTDNADPSNSPFDGRLDQWLPFATTLKNQWIHTTAPQTAGKTENYRLHDGANGILGNFIQLTGGLSDVSSAHNATLPALVVTNDASILASRVYHSAWVTASPNAAGQGYSASQYSCPAHPDYQFLVCAAAHALTGASFAGVSCFAALVDGSINSANTNQAAKQIRIPVAAKVKFAYAAWRGWLSTSTVIAVLQKGPIGAGVDTPISLSMVGHASSTTLFQALAPDATEVNIAAGDYLNWRIQRTLGAANSGFISIGIGLSAVTSSPC